MTRFGFPLFWWGAGMTKSTPPEFAVPIWRWGRQTSTPPRKRRGV